MTLYFIHYSDKWIEHYNYIFFLLLYTSISTFFKLTFSTCCVPSSTSLLCPFSIIIFYLFVLFIFLFLCINYCNIDYYYYYEDKYMFVSRGREELHHSLQQSLNDTVTQLAAIAPELAASTTQHNIASLYVPPSRLKLHRTIATFFCNILLEQRNFTYLNHLSNLKITIIIKVLISIML